ncbi:MAG: methylase [Methylobacter sp.]|nr:MAG: methylase [Methylobacter sp.]PPD19330.1 MAG: methylase [Methylobacter sp.]PPD34574.1 MAG: methylase [Methylomonas sp.]
MSATPKPFSQACENNKQPILDILSTAFTRSATVWEIGSGTGQHACYFASKLPHMQWQPTDRVENLAGIEQWRLESRLDNVLPALALDVADVDWPGQAIEALFTANTLHIMSWRLVEILFQRLSGYLTEHAVACIYGPFNYGGRFTSDSNANFDQWLKSRDPDSGVRDFEAVVVLAAQAGLTLVSDNTMPANNRLLIFNKA